MNKSFEFYLVIFFFILVLAYYLKFFIRSFSTKKKRIYIDLDNTICDFTTAYKEKKDSGICLPQSQDGFFENLKPLPGAIESVLFLNELYDVWILSRPSIKNPNSYSGKRIWVENNLGEEFCKKFILSPDKSLFIGDFLIDDYPHDFKGEQILFGSPEYSDWETVVNYLKEKYCEWT